MELFYYAYIIVCTVQILVLGFIWMGFGKYSEPSERLVKSVSVIVAVKNEVENVQGLVESLCSQNYDDYNVIIVDDYSDDGSFESLELLSSKYEKLNVVRGTYPLSQSSKKSALSHGISLSKAEYLLFTDADCIPRSNNWIQSMVNHTKRNDIVLGVSPYTTQTGLVNSMIQYETKITYFLYSAAALLGLPYMGVGRNLLIKKELLRSVGFYDSHKDVVGGDDDLTINRIANSRNTTVNLSPEGVVNSFPLQSYRERITQKLRHFSVGKYYSFKSKMILGIVNASWIAVNFLFIICLVFNIELLSIISLHILRTLLLFLIFGGLTKLNKVNSVGLKSVYLDNLYSLELLILGPLGLLSKKIVWQKKKNFRKKP